MRKFIIFFVALLFFYSCEYLNVKEKETTTLDIVAIVDAEKLFIEDVSRILPLNLSKEDSIVLVRGYINDWAIKQLLLKNAESNVTLEEVKNIDELVQDYKESLLINSYKESLIKQQLDTVVVEEEIADFYEANKENFKLNEELLKIKFLYLAEATINKNELIKLFKSDKIEDLEALEKQKLSFKTYHFNDSVWSSLDNVMLKLPFSKEYLLNKTKLLQKQDSLGLYLAKVNSVLFRNDIAPVGYIKPTIKQMILHRRKIELIRDIEKILVQDATKNNNLKIY